MSKSKSPAPPKENATFQVGDYVTKVVGDYYFQGFVVAAFMKRSGKLRYVVENDDCILHIFSGKQLELKTR